MAEPTTSSAGARLHVVAAVLEDDGGRVLIAQRPPGKHLEGAWEFPGGKLLRGEDRRSGLARELDEELGLRLVSARPLIRYVHRYPELAVDLDVWRVTRWDGEPVGREGQALAWSRPGELLSRGLLPADRPVVDALMLPDVIAVSPPSAPEGEEAFLDGLEATAARGLAGLIILRRPDLPVEGLAALATGAACRLEGTGCRMSLHGAPDALERVMADSADPAGARLSDRLAGWHVPGRRLAELRSPAPGGLIWRGVSCHDRAELERALRAGATYAFLGPVKPTASHPGQPALGWERFAALVDGLPLPVYAIGGMTPADLDDAWQAGAQGIAAIRSLWGGDA